MERQSLVLLHLSVVARLSNIFCGGVATLKSTLVLAGKSSSIVGAVRSRLVVLNCAIWSDPNNGDVRGEKVRGVPEEV